MGDLAPVLGALLLAALSLWPRLAGAHAGDLFGLGSRAPALAGAAAARRGDFTSVYYNPAGLADARSLAVSLGVLGFGSQLRINGAPAPALSDQVGILVGAVAPVPLGGVLRDRLHVGVLLYVLPDRIERIVARQPDAAFYPYYNDRASRLVVLPGLAARLHERVSLGVSLNVFARLTGAILGNPGATRAIEPRVEEQIITRVRTHLGLKLGPFPLGAGGHLGELAAALVWRQSFSAPYQTVVLADVVGSQLGVNVNAQPLFTPGTLLAGAAWSRRAARGRLSASLDVAWLRWSGYPGPFVTVTSVLPLIGEVAPELPAVRFRDTAEVRFGLERTFALGPRAGAARELAARLGYGFSPSPVPAQTGVTNLADGHRHIVAAGAGLRLALGRAASLTLDAHVQAHLLQPRTDVKGPDVAEDNPGFPRLASSGSVVSGGLLLTFRRGAEGTP